MNSVVADFESEVREASTTIDFSQLPGITFSFQIENNFDDRYFRKWHEKHWSVAVAISLVYITAIFTLQEWMRNRPPFELRKILAFWNAFLCLFSFCGAIRLVPELIHVIYTQGFYDSICDNCYIKDVRIPFWLWLFSWSKVLELGDTIFIVLRKQKLIALHWIHHAITLLSCFYNYSEMASSARWFVSMNYVVHCYMYAYYALKALRVKVPRGISMVITISQIAQMIVGLFMNYLTYYFKATGKKCDVTLHASKIGFTMYAVFFCLFLNFFFGAYVSAKNTTGADLKENQKKSS